MSSEIEKRMVALLEEIAPLPRLINSPGLDQTFEILKREVPQLAVHEYPSRMEAEDWIVPDSWEVKEGFIKDRAGSTIASIEESHLFVAPYSEPVDGWFTRAEIAEHVTTRPDRPDAFAFEHRHAYNYRLVDWGIALPHIRWSELPEDRYYVKIDVECKPGNMKVGEYFLKGRRPETVCICAHIDELCNDDLSGCVAAIEIMRYLETVSDRQYTYQMLLVPEVIGSLFFVHSNPDKIDNTIGMLFLEAVGAGAEWCLKKALAPDTRIEKTLRAAMKASGLSFQEVDFFGGYGNDERVYSWPSVGIPGVALQRFPFDEYHTSDDTPEVVNGQYLLQAVEVGVNFSQILEVDYVPRYTNKLQPWLTRRGLYYDRTRSAEEYQKFNNDLLFNIDGKHSVLDLMEIANLDFQSIYEYLDEFAASGLIEKLDCHRASCHRLQ